MPRLFLLLATCAILLDLSGAIPVPNFSSSFSKKVGKSDTGYRLPENFEAIQYDISLTPYFDDGTNKSFTFDGKVKIVVKPLVENLTAIVFHAKYLNILDLQVSSSENKSVTVLNRTENAEYEFLTINLNETLDTKLQYTVTVDYEGILQKDMSGFYASYYMENRVKKWLGTTQFQPVSARKAFPCFDEPSFKAVFVMSITRPLEISKSLSNMPIRETVFNPDNKTVTETFYPTPRMSTYLLAFIVSEFTSPEINDDADSYFGVWARPGAEGQSKYALEAGQNIVTAMSEYMNIPYYNMTENLKMDQAAIPDFSAGAMENWGLLTYREAYLLFDEEETPLNFKISISTILAHEIAHQWFGDYVTCHWWSDTWLNEGFASFFEFRLSDMAGEQLDLEDQFIINQMQQALLVDANENAPALTNNEINSPAEISNHFGVITYKKGASVITMMENWIGKDTFRKGLQYYQNDRQFNITKPEYLFQFLQKAADEDESLKNYTNTNVQQVMESFTAKNGYPLITVEVDMDNGEVTITQAKFKKADAPTSEVLYNVPITFTNDVELDFENTKPDFVLTEKTKKFTKGSMGHGYVILNKKARGFYRVNYDIHTWGMIKDTLISNRDAIHRFNRAQIVDDLFNLALEDYITYPEMFDVLDFLSNETDYAPWTSAYTGFGALRLAFLHENSTLELIEKHMFTMMGEVIESLGLEEKPTDKNLTKIFRASTLKEACDLGHEECIESAQALFAQLMSNTKKVPPNLKKHIYCTGLRYGSDAEYDFLWNKHETTNVVNEQITILNALGCTRVDKKITEYLTKTTTESSIRDQDRLSAFASATTGNPSNAPVVLEFVKNNIGPMKQMYDDSFFGAISVLARRLSASELNELNDFIVNTTQLTNEEKQVCNGLIESAKKSLEWGSKNKDKVEDWLNTRYNSAANVAISLFLLLVTSVATLFNGKSL